MTASRVLLTDNIFASLDELHRGLEPVGLQLEVAPASDEETLTELARSAVAMVVVYAKISERIIASAASGGCRVISRCGIGYDNIDVGAANRHRVQVTYVPDYCIEEVADYTIALLLAFERGLVAGTLTMRAGGWGFDRRVHRIQGRRLALIGLGRIGRRVAARALAFGLGVTAYDPYVRDWNLDGITRAETLAEALADADYVSLHAPLSPENHHLINEDVLRLMKNQPVLINTARGGLVDLDALTVALDKGTLSGAALDVFEVEPLDSDHPLRSNPRALLTPHMAYFSEQAEVELKTRAIEEVIRAVGGEPPRCPVNQLGVTARG